MRAIIHTVIVGATALFISTTATPTANADTVRKESLPDLSKIIQKVGRRDFPAPGAPTKYFQEPGEDGDTSHYDMRYYHGVVPDDERTNTQSHMIRAYLKFFRDNDLDTWIAHGTLIGWWWNGKRLPWDFDMDTQVSYSTLQELGSKWNNTIHNYTSTDGKTERSYLLDVNPWIWERERGDGMNIIDARWIDVRNGLFIDITGLSEVYPDTAPGIWTCKNDHAYKTSDLYPMRETVFEGVLAKVPYQYDKILVDEYGTSALISTEYNGHIWDYEIREWVKDPNTLKREEQELKLAAHTRRKLRVTLDLGLVGLTRLQFVRLRRRCDVWLFSDLVVLGEMTNLAIDTCRFLELACSLHQTAIMGDSNASLALPEELQVTLTHHGKPIILSFPQDATISDLSDRVSTDLSIPPPNQKFLVGGKLGLQKPPFKDATIPLTQLASKKITLMGSTVAEVSSLNASISAASAPRRPGPIKAALPARHTDYKKIQEEAQYTFHTLRPLPYLPNPDRSLRFLERLRDDAGIKAAMRTHKFSVPLLTEMDPAMHTTHESRTLGLNRNQGEVIELRLRTDAYDGYRDYKTIRNTLCHELAHNVWGPHDRNFWDLCKRIEREVARDDWRSGGQSVGNQEFYDPGNREEEVHDHGGWTGGEFTLGSKGSAETGVGSAGGSVAGGGLSRREVLAKAAEERVKRAKRAEDEARGAGSAS
ncbi:WLM-domain-containing protein [Pyrenochaeta sp. DS3sAY3a]|nr:WLM-domain-containing protein [Pyrenochaeta sp. DS3sAY3a]